MKKGNISKFYLNTEYQNPTMTTQKYAMEHLYS